MMASYIQYNQLNAHAISLESTHNTFGQHANKHSSKHRKGLGKRIQGRLAVAKLTSSLCLRQLSQHIDLESSKATPHTYDRIASLFVYSASRTRHCVRVECPGCRTPADILRSFPRHLPFRATAQSSFYARSQAAAQGVHPITSARPP